MRIGKPLVLAVCVGVSSLALADAGNVAARKSVCVIGWASPTNFQYVVLKKLKIGKNSYGSVNDILPKFISQARDADADAIINYNAAQRFGFFPWRFIRPVVMGTAVKLNEPIDCVALGGTLYQ